MINSANNTVTFYCSKSVIWKDIFTVKVSSVIKHPLLINRLVTRLCASMDTPSPPASMRRSSTLSRPKRLCPSKSDVGQLTSLRQQGFSELNSVLLSSIGLFKKKKEKCCSSVCADVGMIPAKRLVDHQVLFYHGNVRMFYLFVSLSAAHQMSPSNGSLWICLYLSQE